MFDVQQCTILTTETAVEDGDLQSDSSDNCSLHTPEPPSFSIISCNSGIFHTQLSGIIAFSLDVSFMDIESASVKDGPWYGFKLVGDNLDKNLNRRHQRIDRKTQSFHFFQSFAVRDRIDLSSCSQSPNCFSTKPVSQLPIDTLLPSLSDDQILLSNFSTIVSRVLVTELSYFSDTFTDVIIKHIKHDYYDNMSLKSETVSYFCLCIIVFKFVF